MDNERCLYKPITLGAQAEGWALFALEDAGLNRRPGDLFGFTPDGRGVLIECKLIDQPLAPADLIPWQKFSAHQVNWLVEAGKRGGLALVGLYSKSDQKLRLYRIRNRDSLRTAADELWAATLVSSNGLWRFWMPLLVENKTDD